MTVELEAREALWEFAPGQTVRAFTFNGDVPGPTIEAAVGDSLVIRVTNALPQATTLHWHGIRLRAAMDGTQSVQPLIEPGTTFEYRFGVPDAGTFWYHSHVNEIEQIERGLYGALIVRGADEPLVDRERVLMLDDLKLDDSGEVAPFGDPHELHAGREGNVRLVNGRREPELTILAGHVERWRIVNAANTRYVRLGLCGHAFSIIGGDGGLLPRGLEATDVLLTPGERVDIVVGPFREGESFDVTALPYDRGTGESPKERFASVRVGQAAPSRAVLPDVLRPIERLAGGDAATTRVIDLKALMHGGAGQRADAVRVGELQVWDLVNETGQDHPFHLHGFFFQVVPDDGGDVAWKDTVNVPRKSRVRIAWLPDERLGSWMYHCHILEHQALGMMAHFDVVR